MATARTRPSAIRMARAVAGVAAAACLATACAAGGAGDVAEDAAAQGSPPAAAPSGSAAPSATPAPGGRTPTAAPGGRTPTAAPGTPGQLTRAQLREALVGKEAFPRGWDARVDPGGGGASDDGDPGRAKSECDVIEEMYSPGERDSSVPAKAMVSIMAVDSTGSGKAYHIAGINLASFGAGDAGKLLTKVSDVLPRCLAVRTTEEGGDRYESTHVIKTAPRLGDQAIAFATTTRTAGKSWVHGVIAVRVGDVIVGSTFVNLTGDEIQMPDEALIRTQVARIEAVVAGRPVPKA